MKREDLPPRGKGSRGPVKLGQVYWVEDDGESFLVVVVRVGEAGNDLMTVYLYRWPADPPDDLATIEPGDRDFVYIIWKAERSRERWTRLGTIPDFDLEDWPLEPMRHPFSGDLVVPDPVSPGGVIDQRAADSSETDGLAPYGFGTHYTMIKELRLREDRDW